MVTFIEEILDGNLQFLCSASRVTLGDLLRGFIEGLEVLLGIFLILCLFFFRYTFDYHENDIFWCTADIGWITGHSYIVYGPMANGATSVLVMSNFTFKLHLTLKSGRLLASDFYA